MNFLKNRAISQGVTQKSIAEQFNVSIPTVKRWYSGSGLSLEQANKICEYLGLSLGEALTSIQNHSETFQYTHKQENFFANNPDCLAFFDNLLRGKSAKQIQRKFSLSQIKTESYLLQLDKLELLELHHNNKIKLLVKGEPVWSKDGPLTKKLKPDILTDFRARSKNIYDSFYLHEFSTEDMKQICLKIDELFQIASRANNRAIINKKENKSYGFNISLKEFQWSLDKFLT